MWHLHIHELKPEISEDGKEVTVRGTGPAVVFVFRTEYEQNLGKLSFFKVLWENLKKELN